MPGIISRLNCFSKKKKGKGRKDKLRLLDDDDQSTKQLLLSAASSSLTSPTRRVGASSETHSISLSPKNSRDLQNDDNSIPTVDPDYKHQSGSCSLSDAGVTIGSQNQSLTGFSQAASAYGSVMRPSALGGGSSLAGDSVERGYHHGIHHQKHLMSSPYEPQPRRAAEEMLEVYAPAGKLGLVIDVPDTADSTPVVHGVKDSCPIRGEINVGDRLVAVDDVDVREMSAVEVSRLISRKSGQERRRLTIVRTVRGGGAIYS